MPWEAGRKWGIVVDKIRTAGGVLAAARRRTDNHDGVIVVDKTRTAGGVLAAARRRTDRHGLATLPCQSRRVRHELLATAHAELAGDGQSKRFCQAVEMP